MKKYLVIILFIAIFLPNIAFGALADGLVGYWELEEASGTRVDSTANNNDLTDVNTVTQGTGIIGNAADFEADTNEQLESATATGFPSGDNARSISVWVKFETLPSVVYVISTYGAGSGNNQWSLWLRNTAGTYKLQLDFFGGSDDSNNWALSAGVFYHIVVTYDGTTLRFYIDENTFGTATPSNYNTTVSGDGIVVSGRFSDDLFMDGLIDELAYWNKELSTDEIGELYNSGAGCAYPLTGCGVVEAPPVSDLWIDFSMIWESIKSFWNKLT